MAAVTRSRSAYSGKISNGSSNLYTIPTIELNIASTKSSIKDLHIDLSFGECTCVEPDNGNDTFDDLPANDCCFRKARAHDKDIDTQILRAKCIFNIADEVTGAISHMP